LVRATLPGEAAWNRRPAGLTEFGRKRWRYLRGSATYNGWARMSAKTITGDGLIMTKVFVVTNKLGIHARPAALFVKTANRFSCDIFVEKDGEKVNGKSIMGLMMLAAGPGSKLTVFAEGEDASEALAELELLVKRKFDEE